MCTNVGVISRLCNVGCTYVYSQTYIIVDCLRDVLKIFTYYPPCYCHIAIDKKIIVVYKYVHLR